MCLPKKRGTVTDVPCDLACPISILAGHKREARLATKHGCAPAISLRPLLVIARQDAGNTTTTCKANASAQ